MTTFVIISGFARSGKSTLSDLLENVNGYSIASSSSILDTETLKYFGIPLTKQNIKVLVTKNEKEFQRLLKRSGFTGQNFESVREAKIHVAEKYIVPLHTRAFFANACLGLETVKDNETRVIFSSIKDERDIVLRTIRQLEGDNTIIKVNIERNGQLKGVDNRSLFYSPDITLYNDGITPEELLENFLQYVEDFENGYEEI